VTSALVHDTAYERNTVGVGLERVDAEDSGERTPGVVVVELDEIGEVDGEVLLADAARPSIETDLKASEEKAPVGLAVVIVESQLECRGRRVVFALEATVGVRGAWKVADQEGVQAVRVAVQRE
jgi:hypothetical protein